MLNVAKVGLVLVGLIFAWLFAAAFSDYRHQNYEWSSDFGNCPDAVGAMKTALSLGLVADIGLVIIGRGRA